jgi:hypothetical protein
VTWNDKTPVKDFLYAILKPLYVDKEIDDELETLTKAKIKVVGGLRKFDYNELVQLKVSPGVAKEITSITEALKGNLAFNTLIIYGTILATELKIAILLNICATLTLKFYLLL